MHGGLLTMKVTQMKKYFAVAGALTGLFAGPAAFAADSHGFDAAFYMTQLHYAGINAIDVDDYTDNRMRVLVLRPDGRKVVEFFDKSTITQVR